MLQPVQNYEKKKWNPRPCRCTINLLTRYPLCLFITFVSIMLIRSQYFTNTYSPPHLPWPSPLINYTRPGVMADMVKENREKGEESPVVVNHDCLHHFRWGCFLHGSSGSGAGGHAAHLSDSVASGDHDPEEEGLADGTIKACCKTLNFELIFLPLS